MDKLIFEKHDYKIYETKHRDIYLRDVSPESAVVLALFEGKVVVCKQYREGAAGYTYELPGGGIGSGENKETAARRELSEETGLLACEELVYLGEISPHPCLINHVTHLYFAGETTMANKQQLDDGENIEVNFYELDDIFEKVTNTSWKNSEMVHALFLAVRKGLLPTTR